MVDVQIAIKKAARSRFKDILEATALIKKTSSGRRLSSTQLETERKDALEKAAKIVLGEKDGDTIDDIEIESVVEEAIKSGIQETMDGCMETAKLLTGSERDNAVESCKTDTVKKQYAEMTGVSISDVSATDVNLALGNAARVKIQDIIKSSLSSTTTFSRRRRLSR